MLFSLSAIGQDDTLILKGSPLPTASLSGYYNICLGESADIPVYLTNGPVWDVTFSDGTTQWTVTGITSSPYHLLVSPPSVRSYTIVSVIGDGGCNGSTSGAATVIPLNDPTLFTLACTSTTFCPGLVSGDFTLNGSVNGTIYHLRYVDDVNPIVTMIGTGNPLIFPGIGTAGTVECIAENAAGCQSVMNGTITLTQNSIPGSATTINGPTSICAGTMGVTYSIPTGIPNATSYTWGVPVGSTIITNNGTSITVNIGNTSGDITVSGVNSCQGGPAFVMPITVTSAPNVAISTSSTTICAGDEIDLVAGNNQTGSTYTWSTGQSGDNITVTPIGNTTYVVTVTGSNNCSATANITINVNPVPTPVINIPTSVCLQEHIALSASPLGGTWTGLGVGNDTLYTEICGAGTHHLAYTVNNGGCSATTDHYVVINPLPYVTWEIVPGPFTTGTPSLNMAGYVYPAPESGRDWSFDGPTGSFIGSTFDASTAGAGTHLITYTYTDLNGCSDDAGIYITIATGNGTNSIEDVDAVKNINMYPNPTTDQINLEGINLQEIKALYVVNTLGQVVFMTEPDSEYTTIQVSSLPAGNYQLVFADKQGNFIGLKRFIKQ